MQHHRLLLPFALVSLILVMAVSGCAGRSGPPQPTSEPIATPNALYNIATSTISTPAASATSEQGTDGDAAAGQRTFESKCASCHGAQGEGVAGKGKGIATWTMSASDFDDLLRTGAKGALGTEHIFGPSQISPSGVKNVYAYVLSLQKK
jgi:mono/diheme cytochrome c family protein